MLSSSAMAWARVISGCCGSGGGPVPAGRGLGRAHRALRGLQHPGRLAGRLPPRPAPGCPVVRPPAAGVATAGPPPGRYGAASALVRLCWRLSARASCWALPSRQPTTTSPSTQAMT